MVAGEALYSGILESLYTGLEGLDVSDYAWDASDGWTQARRLQRDGEGLVHLEAWIDLGGVVQLGRHHLIHDAALIYACRYIADDDSVSQGRFHAAARAALEYLIGWAHNSTRAIPTGYQIEAISDDWLAGTVSFQLHTPRG